MQAILKNWPKQEDSELIGDLLVRYWELHDIPYRPGVSEADLSFFERRYAVHLPAEFRECYLSSNGTLVPGATGCDQNGFTFWELHLVRPDADDCWAFEFADYMEESWSFAIALRGGVGIGLGAVYLLGDISGVPLMIAKGLAEFVDLYLRNDERLYPHGARVYNEPSAPVDNRGDVA